MSPERQSPLSCLPLGPISQMKIPPLIGNLPRCDGCLPKWAGKPLTALCWGHGPLLAFISSYSLSLVVTSQAQTHTGSEAMDHDPGAPWISFSHHSVSQHPGLCLTWVLPTLGLHIKPLGQALCDWLCECFYFLCLFL